MDSMKRPTVSFSVCVAKLFGIKKVRFGQNYAINKVANLARFLGAFVII